MTPLVGKNERGTELVLLPLDDMASPDIRKVLDGSQAQCYRSYDNLEVLEVKTEALGG